MYNSHLIPIDIWKKILDEDMNFHTGRSGSNINIFHNTIDECLPYLTGKSSVLFVGSGFGGPAKRIHELTGIECELLTNSLQEAEYTQDMFKTHLCSVERFRPTRKYDIAIFLESFSSIAHAMNDAIKPMDEALYYVADCCDEMLILDAVSMADTHYESPMTETMFLTNAQMYDVIQSMNFNVKHKVNWSAEDDDWVTLTMMRYLAKMNSLTPDERKYPGVAELYETVNLAYQRSKWFGENLGQSLYHIEKNS